MPPQGRQLAQAHQVLKSLGGGFGKANIKPKRVTQFVGHDTFCQF